MSNVTGRRGAAVRRGVLAATLDELAETGYAALTMENVATRAGVHKTTLYRRWSDRDALLTDAFLELAAEDFTIPDTGDLDADLRVGLRKRVAWLSGPYGRPLIALLVSDAARLPGIAEAMRRVVAVRVEMVTPRINSAIQQGQLPAGTDPMKLLTTLLAPIYLSLLVTRQTVTDEDCDRAARVALTAARAGLLCSSPG